MNTRNIVKCIKSIRIIQVRVAVEENSGKQRLVSFYISIIYDVTYYFPPELNLFNSNTSYLY